MLSLAQPNLGPNISKIHPPRGSVFQYRLRFKRVQTEMFLFVECNVMLHMIESSCHQAFFATLRHNQANIVQKEKERDKEEAKKNENNNKNLNKK